MFQIFPNINVDWMGLRKPFVFISIAVLLAGLISAAGRQLTPGGTDAFNLGVDFQGGTVITVKFREKPGPDQIRAALNNVGVTEPIIQDSTDKTDEVLIKIPIVEGREDIGAPAATEQPAEQPADVNANIAAGTAPGEQPAAAAGSTQVERGRQIVKSALDTFGREATPGTLLAQDPEAAYQIVGTDSVGPIAGKQLRDAAVIATLLGLTGMLLFIAFRYDWTYAAGAVVAVFHDVLVTLAFFSLFQWEVSLTVLAALLTLVGFSVNDSIVIFDRIRENVTRNRTESLYSLTNKAINQTMSRTIITNGLTFLAVLALVIWGGEVLRGFSLALLVGSVTGTFSTIAIASPIAIWWQSKLGRAEMKDVQAPKGSAGEKLASASRRSVTRRPVTR
ncbi:MAG TPA: protein translocase subunit SecF [Pyrinomonadaceae bacterium]|nr:protein translocase subunit SecF [Pyrinomonadaceae bacterium]